MLAAILSAFRQPSNVPTRPLTPTPAPVLPEILDRIIDHADPKTAHTTLPLVSHQTLVRARHNLFSTLTFSTDNPNFDAFLTLIDVPWTSFTSAVESLHLSGLFRPRRHGKKYRYPYDVRWDMRRLARNLRHVTTLRLSDMMWFRLPAHVRELLFVQMHSVTTLQVDYVHFYNTDLVELFTLLPPRITTLMFLHLEFQGEIDLPETMYSSLLNLHFAALDPSLLVALKDMWDPSLNRDVHVAVDTFYLNLIPLTLPEAKTYTPLISRFLHSVGPTLTALFVNVSEPFFDFEVLRLYESIDLSTCTKLTHISIATILLDHTSPDSESMLATVWKVLSNLPSHSVIDRITLTFTFSPSPPPPSLSPSSLSSEENGENDVVKAHMAELDLIHWPTLLARLQKTFRNLKCLNILFGGTHFAYCDRHPGTLVSYVEALNRLGLGEEIASVGLSPVGHPNAKKNYLSDSYFPHY